MGISIFNYHQYYNCFRRINVYGYDISLDELEKNIGCPVNTPGDSYFRRAHRYAINTHKEQLIKFLKERKND